MSPTIRFDPPPRQDAITLDRINEMLALKPRRTQLASEWANALHAPHGQYKNWTMVLPFCETLGNAFNTMCDVPGSGLMSGKNQRCFAFLDDANENPASLERVRSWLAAVGEFVAIRDCLALSFAIDYDRERGDPSQSQTPVGALRARAKPYDAAPTKDTFRAADELVEACVRFLQVMTCFSSANVVVAMPASRPDKAFDLPAHLASGIAATSGKRNLSAAVATTGPRPALKNLPLAEKLEALQGSVRVEEGALAGRIVLLIDDLYQSGVTMNYVAMELLAAGARKVFGLACEKTCRNDDNVSGGR